MKLRLLKIWLCVLFASELCSLSVVSVLNLMSGPTVLESGKEINYLPMIIVLISLYVLVITAGALTMFFNSLRRVRNNGLLRFLSFFLLPLAILTLDASARWGTSDVTIVPMIYGPFLLFLTIAYIWFSRWLRRDAKQ
jgi:hypothetical protein